MKFKKMNINCVCTIVSSNYLAYAVTLYKSIKKYYSDVDFLVLIVDRKSEEISKAVKRSGLNVIYADELLIADFEHIAFKYDVVELNTALKPSFLKLLFGLNYKSLIYLDPDICLYSKLAPVYSALENSNIVLIPHITNAVMDGFRPSEIDFLRAGVFNLGFVALKNVKESIRLLDWWEERCLSYGFNDMSFGTFVDQKWMDLAPCLFEGVNILKNPACNVAYWNLHERFLDEKKGQLLVNNEPLCFFHFSGVNVFNSYTLSKYQDRYIILESTVLKGLISDYCKSVIANEHEMYSKINYTFNTFNNGEKINHLARRASCTDKRFSKKPFDNKSINYKYLKKYGFLKKSGESYSNINTTNLSTKKIELKLFNLVIRIFAKLIGINRISSILQYASILNRESNLGSVIYNKDFNFKHEKHRYRFE